MTTTLLPAPPSPPAREDLRPIRACVLREPGRPVSVETIGLAPPRAGEARVRIAAAGVCHSDLHLADGSLGDGRWPMVLGHEGAGVVEAVGPGVSGVGPGDRVVLSMVASCGTCGPCRSGRRTLCEPVGRRSAGGTMPDGTSRLVDDHGVSIQHGLTVACFAERAVVAADALVRVADDVALWQAALLGCSALTGFGAVAHAARVAIGDRVAVIGCGGVGLQVIAAAAMAGAGAVIAVDRRPEKLAHARRRGATHTVLADGGDPAADVARIAQGGVDYAFEVVGAAATIRTAWESLRPGGTAIVVGLAPKGVEVSLPAIDFLSEKSIIGSYYGSGDPVRILPQLIELVRAGRLELADLVSHRIGLDGIPDALERLRRGEGGRSIVVLDETLAGIEVDR